jgi:nitrogen fixation protein FixH
MLFDALQPPGHPISDRLRGVSAEFDRPVRDNHDGSNLQIWRMTVQWKTAQVGAGWFTSRSQPRDGSWKIVVNQMGLICGDR